MYSTKDTEEKVFESKFLAPGVHKVRISEIKGEAPEGRSPYLELCFVDPDDKTTEVKFYMSDAAKPKSLEKLLHLGTKCIPRDVMDSIKGDSLADYGANLNAALAGKVVRVKFVGEEIEGKEGKHNWTKAGIGLPTFAEAVKEGAEYSAISDEDTKLTYDENNKWDLKRLPVADTETDTEFGGGTSDTEDDEPF